MGGLEGVLEFGDLLAVTALELGDLAGERSDDVAGLVWSGVAVVGCAGLRPGALLLDAVPDGGLPVEASETGGGGQAAKGDWLPCADHVIECCLGAGGCGGGAAGGLLQ